MIPKVTGVKHIADYQLELAFEDGLTAFVDFKDRVIGRSGLWTALRDLSFFKQVRVDPELQTIVWPNGVDVCPDVLYALATGKPLATAEPAQDAMRP